MTGPGAVIFDLGGVLLTPGDAAARDRWERRLGLAAGELSPIVWDAIGPGPHLRDDGEIRARIAARLDLPPPDAARLLRDFHAHWGVEPRLADLAGELRAAGCRTAILTNAGPAARYAIVRVAGLDRLFDPIVISAEEGIEKPDPRIYTLAAERIGLPAAACVFVDDLRSHVDGARRAGMAGVPHRSVEETLRRLRDLLAVPGRTP